LKVTCEPDCRNADSLTKALSRAKPRTAGVPAGSFTRHIHEPKLSKPNPSLRKSGFELAVDVFRSPVGEARCQPSRGRRALPPVAACGGAVDRADDIVFELVLECPHPGGLQ
jgi:hypothetical protein